MVNHRCASLNCQNSRKNCPGMTFVRFPKDQARCNAWTQYSRRPDLQKLNAEYLYKHAILCEEHFEDNQWMNKDMKHLGLIHTAKPTVFIESDASEQTSVKRRTSKHRSSGGHKKQRLTGTGIAVKLECDSEPMTKQMKFRKDESSEQMNCDLEETEDSGHRDSCTHFSSEEQIEEETDSADTGQKNLNKEMETLKQQMFEQGGKKLKASIVKMGSNKFFLVLPVPSSSS